MHERPAGDEDSGSEVARRRTRRRLTMVLLGTFVLVTAGMVVGYVAASRHRRPGHHVSAVPLIVGLVLLGLTLVVLGVVLWRLLNRPDYQRAMHYPWRRRMRVAKALRRGDPVGVDDLPSQRPSSR
jgi:heme/copper-type cytochrome/quinol oxidase subunit 3